MSSSGDGADWPTPPTDRQWTSLGVGDPRPLGGGHQSKLFQVTVAGRAVVVKLVPGRDTDEAALRRRAEFLIRLSADYPDPVAPIVVNGHMVNRLGEWLAVGFPFVDGRPPDPHSADEVRLMGRTLAGLHRRLAISTGAPLRPVRVLTIPELESHPDYRTLHARPFQLLHGDYAPANLILERDRLRIIDFDDCGDGPVEFELGNTLFMMLFDCTVNEIGPARPGNAAERYRSFRSNLVSSYSSAAQRMIDEDLLDAAIDLRRSALKHWLDRRSAAPVGIRNADSAWRRVLERFVRSPPPTYRP